MSETDPCAACPSLLAAQLSLLEDRRADVADLLEVGGRHDEVLVDAIANVLVVAGLAIRAALAVLSPQEIRDLRGRTWSTESARLGTCWWGREA